MSKLISEIGGFMTIESWLAFCTIALLATATPGPAALLVATNSLAVGFKRALLTVFGNVSGLLLMSSCSVIGLSGLLLHSTAAFTVVKILGALYLIYIGINLWRKGLGQVSLPGGVKKQKSAVRLYLDGVLVALTNPKAIVFTTALFPQFIDTSAPLLAQFSLLVTTFMCLSFCCLCMYSFLAQSAKKRAIKWVSGHVIGKMFGMTFIGAGCVLASAER